MKTISQGILRVYFFFSIRKRKETRPFLLFRFFVHIILRRLRGHLVKCELIARLCS